MIVAEVVAANNGAAVMWRVGSGTCQSSNDGEIGSVVGGDVSYLGQARVKVSLSHIDSREEEVVSALTDCIWGRSFTLRRRQIAF
jgi:hypothetical protein